jgi:hypothetical protein
MKIFLTTTLVAILAIGLIGISNGSSNSNTIDNAFAQMDSANSTMMKENVTHGMIMNATLAYAAQHGSEIGKEYREKGESIGKEFEKMGNNTTTMNENSTTMMNATLPMSLEGNNTAKPMNAIIPMSFIGNDTSKKP